MQDTENFELEPGKLEASLQLASFHGTRGAMQAARGEKASVVLASSEPYELQHQAASQCACWCSTGTTVREVTSGFEVCSTEQISCLIPQT